MKRLLALLLLLASPTFAQEIAPGPYLPPPPVPVDAQTQNVVYTTLNPPPDGTSFTWTGFVNTQSSGGGVSGGNVPGYNTATGTFLFGYMQSTITYKLFNSSEWPSSPDNMVNGFKYSWEYFNQDFSRGSLSGNFKLLGLNNSILENYNFTFPKTTQGWTLESGQIDFNSPFNRSDVTGFELSFTGKDDRFWAGYYGPQIRGLDLDILYTSAPPPPPPPPNFLYWNSLAGEWGTFTLNEPTTVRYGAEGTYVYVTFQPGTYECSNGAWGTDPIGGVVKSCEAGTNTAPPVVPEAVDCTLTPTDPSCAVLVYTDPTLIADSIVDDVVADATDTTNDTIINTGSDDGSSDGTEVVAEEENVVADNTATEDTTSDDSTDEELANEEKIVAVETTTTTTLESTVAATYRELSDEEKAAILADAISKNVLEGALSIASDATAAAANNSGGTVTQSETTSRSSSSQSSSTFVAQETTAEFKNEEQKVEMVEMSDAGSDTLENGRQMGKEALAATINQTEQSAAESISQAESIAISSAESQTVAVVASNDSSQQNTFEDNTGPASNKIEEVDDGSRKEAQQVVFEDFSATSTSQEIEQQIVAQSDTTNDIDTSTGFVETPIDQQDQNTGVVAFVDNQTVEQTDTFAEAMQLDIKPVIEEKADGDYEFVQQVVAASQEQKQDEVNNTGFSEDEKVTIASDPALANAFNVAPNIINLEVAGVLNNKPEEKSDAEKAADKVVAANKEQQDEINKNYMDADQSGIVAAIGADTDVTSYRTAMIRDNNVWYKPEDIYKNVVYKDNVRGAYFLEKGNTDTYKKMVEEQYK